MLIIRLDAIGDYVLFRNFLEIVRTSDRYRDYAITLLGNAVWRSLSEELDTEFVDTFIWLDRFRFVKDHAYRKEKLREIGAAGYEIALSPVYSRGFIFSDALVKLVNAGEKIGSEGCLSNMLRCRRRRAMPITPGLYRRATGSSSSSTGIRSSLKISCGYGSTCPDPR